MRNENILAKRALERPVFGWGGWGRNRVLDEAGHDISITDGLWVIVLGINGVVGLASMTALFLLPVALLLVRYPPRTWRSPGCAAAGLGVLLELYLIDNLSNAMINPIYIMAAGGLAGLQGPGRRRVHGDRLDDAGLDAELATPLDPERDQRRATADGFEDLARSLRGPAPERAVAAWTRALEIREELHEANPDDGPNQAALVAGLNDLAWFLAVDAPPGVRAGHGGGACHAGHRTRSRFGHGVEHPGRGLPPRGRPPGRRAGPERAIELGGGHGLDFLFLALALDKVGENERGTPLPEPRGRLGRRPPDRGRHAGAPSCRGRRAGVAGSTGRAAGSLLSPTASAAQDDPAGRRAFGAAHSLVALVLVAVTPTCRQYASTGHTGHAGRAAVQTCLPNGTHRSLISTW